MIRTFLSAVLSLGALAAHAEVPRVVADIAPVGAIAARIMQGVGVPDVLIPNGASPHDYALRPSEARMLAQADMVVWVGPGLTRWLEGPLDTLAGDTERLTLMEGPITLLPFREGEDFGDEGHAGHDDHDPDHDHDHGQDDPHLWLDPANGIVIAALIADRLATLDPENATRYRSNATLFSEQLKAEILEIEAEIAPARGKPFLTLHDALQYFEAAFDLPASGAIYLGDGGAPGPARLSDMRDRLGQTPVFCAFAEPQMNAALIETLTEGQDVQVVTLNPMGDSGLPLTDQYPALLREMARGMAACLGR